ncbi:MAG TPA: CoA protein activase [Kosmotogaceae bacterium]|nr:MAG: CoA-substrate-specific enzyme activase [Thermotogales bacterium 46_20]HAA85561.1 CoA protein activase [Kosmotogaceae bacterium]
MLYYACSYVPLEILISSGLPFRRLPVNRAFEHPELHTNLCGYCKAVYSKVTELSEEDVFITVDSCDAMRRMGDVIQQQSSCRVFSLRLPWKKDSSATEFFRTQLEALNRFLSELRGQEITRDDLDRGISQFNMMVDKLLAMHMTGVPYHQINEAFFLAEQGQLYNNPSEPSHGTGPRIAYLGAVSDAVMIEEVVRAAGGILVLNESCMGMRGFTAKTEKKEPFLLSVATRLISGRIPCGRFAEGLSEYTARLLREVNADGIVFGIPKFCDFYGFQLAMTELLLPHTVVEIDFGDSSRGQLLTRVGAFMESLKREVPGTRKEKSGSFYAGIDSGSTTTNIVVLDQKGEIVFSHSRKTGVYPKKVADELFSQMLQEVGIGASDISCCIATGYGRENVSFATSSVTEITCHARGARKLLPEINTVIDIGGQDSKVISLEDRDMVRDFTMNDKCAAGTGRFLEVMSGIMEEDLQQMSEAAFRSKKALSISSVCTVFAESEVISLISNGEKIEDISAALFRAIAKRILAMFKRVSGRGPVGFTGGVAKVPGMARALEDAIGDEIIVPPHPDIAGALGAALLAMEQGEKK